LIKIITRKMKIDFFILCNPGNEFGARSIEKLVIRY